MSERHGSLHPNGLILNVSHMSVCTVHETTGSRLLIDYYHSPFRQNLYDIVVFLRWNRSDEPKDSVSVHFAFRISH